MKPPVVGELEWLNRAYLLLDELASRGLNNPCDRAAFEISEYLLRLSRGEPRADLLRNAAKRSGDADYRPLAAYLLRDMSREALQQSIAKIPLKRIACGVVRTGKGLLFSAR